MRREGYNKFLYIFIAIAFDPVTNILWDTENGPTDMMR
jgi:hypothetical protein